MKEDNYWLEICGIVFMVGYIICTYIANVSVVPETVLTFFLYGFSAFGLLNIILKGYIDNLYIKWYLVFVLLSVVAYMYCKGSDSGSTFFSLVVTLLLTNAFVQFVNKAIDFKIVCYSYLIGSLLMFLFLVASGALHEDERLGTSVMGNANTFAVYFMVPGLLAVWLLLYEKKPILRLFAMIVLGVDYYALFLSGGRKFILIPIVFFYVILLRKKDSQGKNHVFMYTAIILAIVGIVFYLMMTNEMLYSAIGWRMEQLINMVTGKGEIGGSNTIRKGMRELAFSEGLKSPIWGYGFDSFKYLSKIKLNYYAYAHNNFAEIWYDYGIIGMGVYYFYYYKIMLMSFDMYYYNEAFSNYVLAIIISILVFEYGGVTFNLYPIQILLCLTSVAYTITLDEFEKDDSNYEQVQDGYYVVKGR